MSDGFFDPAGARRAVRRMKLRRALAEVRALNAALLDRLDQAGEAQCDAIAAAVQRRIDLLDRDGEGAIGREAIDHVEREDVREQELLQGVDLILQLLNALLKGMGQGCFSIPGFHDGSIPGFHDGIAGAAHNYAPATAHRFCAGAK